jgi:hypothetical protein
VKKVGMGMSYRTNGEKPNSYRIMRGKPEGKRPLGKPMFGWLDSIKMDGGVIGWKGKDRIDGAEKEIRAGLLLRR